MSEENSLSHEKLSANELGVLESLNVKSDETSGDEGTTPGLQASLREAFIARYQGPEVQVTLYDKVAEHYDQMVEVSHNLSADITAEFANKYSHLLPKNPKILDAFAGTGLVGEKLHKLYGFSNIDGFDGSTEMLKIADTKRVYEQLLYFLVEDDSVLPFGDSVYDAVVMSGSLFRVSTFLEFMRITKPGGIIVHVCRMSQLSLKLYQSLLARCHQWEKEGKWRRLLEEISDRQYDSTSPAFVQVYQVL